MITRQQSWELLNAHMKNKNLIRHCLAVETVMRSLARELRTKNQELKAEDYNEEIWGIVGLLHDGDYEEVKDKPALHTIKMSEWLKEAGETDERILSAILSHNFAHTGQNPPKNNLEWSLYCCDELTGLIVAVGLVRPDRKLASVSLNSILDKWNKPKFAAGAKREDIEKCEEKLGIKLDEFITIGLTAMKNISTELGL